MTKKNETQSGKTALVRGIPQSYNNSIKPDPTTTIDVELAKKQHRDYCDMLAKCGLQVVSVPTDNRFPDCCFIEDTAIMLGNKAVITVPGALSRKGEPLAVKSQLGTLGFELVSIFPPGTIDGGDVLQIGKTIYVGLSERTNKEAIRQLTTIASPEGYTVVPVPIKNTLHLKTVCTNIGELIVIYDPGHFDPAVFKSRYQEIQTTPSEGYAANVLAINGKVLVAKNYPEIKEKIEAQGFETFELPMTEFQKAQGSLTCLSIIA